MSTDKKNTKPWNPEDMRFVTFLDILGFKDSVLREDHSEIYKRLLNLSNSIENIEKTVNGTELNEIKSEVKSFTFSDSIIIFSKSNSINDLNAMLITAIQVMTDSIEMGIPLKGAMAYGKISINQNKRIFFGQPIIDSYLLEEDVKYFGVTIHNSVEKFVGSISEEERTLYDTLTFEAITPLKTSKVSHQNINWFLDSITKNNIDNATNDIKRVKLIELVNKFKLSTSGSPRQYIDNTVKIIEELYK